MSEDPPATKKSRHDSNMMGHPIFGDLLEKLPQYRFPTFLQLLNRVRCLKSQSSNSLRATYKLVASELAPIWKEAFVVPIITAHALATKLQTDIEKKIGDVRRHYDRIVNHPEKLTSEISEMKAVYSITKCICFLKKTHR